MDKKKIIEFLRQNNLSEVEELSNENGILVLRFYYDFDENEAKAAKAYANDESDDEDQGDIWHEEFFKPYLNDLAVDNVGEIIEELMDKLEIDAQYVSYDVDDEDYAYNEFVGVFYEKDTDANIEDILEQLEL